MNKKRTGSVKLKSTAKSTAVEPVKVQEVEPLHQLPAPKRGPGRPRKNTLSTFDMPKVSEESASFEDAKKRSKDLDGKALITFRRAMAEAEKLLMSPAESDGGGTNNEITAVTKEALQKRVTRRLNVLDRFLTDDKLVELLAFSSLKEVGIYEGILLDKSLVLSGQPTVIIGDADRKNMDEVMPRLLTEMKRRGLITSVSERKIEFTTPGD